MIKPKPTIDREATQKELDCIRETEDMLAEENKLPPASQMIRNIATDHWRSLKAFIKASIYFSMIFTFLFYFICDNLYF